MHKKNASFNNQVNINIDEVVSGFFFVEMPNDHFENSKRSIWRKLKEYLLNER